eukprot:9841256-Lingulodinium_polyedra.AAC.1
MGGLVTERRLGKRAGPTKVVVERHQAPLAILFGWGIAACATLPAVASIGAELAMAVAVVNGRVVCTIICHPGHFRCLRPSGSPPEQKQRFRRSSRGDSLDELGVVCPGSAREPQGPDPTAVERVSRLSTMAKSGARSAFSADRINQRSGFRRGKKHNKTIVEDAFGNHGRVPCEQLWPRSLVSGPRAR